MSEIVRGQVQDDQEVQLYVEAMAGSRDSYCHHCRSRFVLGVPQIFWAKSTGSVGAYAHRQFDALGVAHCVVGIMLQVP